jgi:hypothetical protein
VLGWELDRNIVINMRIVSKEAMRLEIDPHICELQLGLLEFEKLNVCVHVTNSSSQIFFLTH